MRKKTFVRSECRSLVQIPSDPRIRRVMNKKTQHHPKKDSIPHSPKQDPKQLKDNSKFPIARLVEKNKEWPPKSSTE